MDNSLINFLLQESSDLSNWSDVTNEPVLNLTLQNQVTRHCPPAAVFIGSKRLSIAVAVNLDFDSLPWPHLDLLSFFRH